MKKKLFSGVVFALIALSMEASSSFAGELVADPATTVIGKPVKVILFVKLAEGERAILPATVTAPEGVELHGKGASKVTKGEGDVTLQTMVYTLIPYVMGEVTIDPIPYSVSDISGAIDRREAGPVTFTVVSIREGKEDKNHLKEINPPVPVKVRWAEFIEELIALAVALVAGALLWRWWSLRAKSKPAPPPPPPPPAHEVAYSRFDQLTKKLAGQRVTPREFYFELSEIVRDYLERRFGFPALERTTGELRREVDERYVRSDIQGSLMALLDECDRVKFAKGEAGQGDEEIALQKGRAIVDATRIKDDLASEDQPS